jgi:hypothetical protein
MNEELAILTEKLNNKLLKYPQETINRLKNIAEELAEKDYFYYLSETAYNMYRLRILNISGCRPKEKREIFGNRYVHGVIPNISPTPFFIDSDHYNEVTKILKSLSDLNRLLYTLYEKGDISVKNILSEHSNLEGDLNVGLQYEDVSPIYRVDTVGNLIVVDKNCLPGGLFYSGMVHNLFIKNFEDWIWEIFKSRPKIQNFSHMWHDIQEIYNEYCKNFSVRPISRPTIAFVINKYSGLRGDMKIAADFAAQHFGRDKVLLVYPENLTYDNKNKYLMANKNRKVDIVYRLVRTPYYKWYDSEEKRGIIAILQATKENRVCCIPPWNRFLSAHSYPATLHVASVKNYLTSTCPDCYDCLIEHLPQTSMVDISSINDVTLKHIDLSKIVLKTIDSTGARGVTILKQLNREDRLTVFNRITREAKSNSLVIQSYENPRKTSNVILYNGKLVKTRMFIKESYFYVHGKVPSFGNVMATTDNLKIHGGSGTWMSPIFIHDTNGSNP